MPLYPERKLLRMGNRVVTITVGIKPDHEIFTVHEKLIRESSMLIDADFMIYNQWLYTERLFMKAEGDDRSTSEGRSLIKGYLLGHHLGDVKYRDTLMDALIKWGSIADIEDRVTLVSEHAVAVFDDTEVKDPLRKFIADFTVWNTEYDLWSENYKRFPEDFVAMVSHGYAFRCHLGGSGPSKRASLQACSYHCHGDKPCYKAKSERTSASGPTSSQPLKRRKTNHATNDEPADEELESTPSTVFDKAPKKN
ncbi:hypothetical protein J4E91_003122 [Alternaria rosae]|nr:hypothetical protein J4E91_003122 [Alternaria rosae]